MNAKLVSKEGNIVKFTFEVGPEKLEEGMVYAYNKNKNKLSLPGFRKGKAPRKLIEAEYGPEVFYDDAVNFVLNTEYEVAVKELELDVVSRPDIDAPVIDKKEGIKFEVEVTVKPEVKLGQYKGVEIEKVETAIPEDGVENELKRVQEQNSRLIAVEDRAAQMGDIVNISFDGKVDGVAFEGGQSDSYDLTLGSHSFIDTFEDQIAGHSIGDTFDVNVTFPEKYQAEDLAGKAAVFTVELKGINVKELPEINDEFAQDVSEFETLDEYKASIEGKLKETAEANAKQIKSDRVIDKVIENTEMDIPEVMYENKIDQMINDFKNNIASQGLSIDVYCQYLGTTVEGLRSSFRESAEKSVKARLVLEAVAAAENIDATEEEIDEQIEKIASSYGIEKEKALEIFKEDDRRNVKGDLLVQKAAKVLEDSSVEVQADKKEA
ncbi:trigger factor [Lachnospiraceae bacterium NSJ-143]|nr:trigger factor [Lachnospiraceae bacterium NSJ-143]